jgi:putative transposase
MGEKRSNHTVYNVNYHFVWCRQSEIDCLQIFDLQCPKYRHSILEPIEDSLEASFRDVCDEYGYEILSLHISPDHVHLFLSAIVSR